MAAKPLAQQIPTFGALDLMAQHIHTLALLPLKLTHKGLRVFKGILRYFPLLPDTCHSSDVRFYCIGEAELPSTSLYQRRQRWYHSL